MQTAFVSTECCGEASNTVGKPVMTQLRITRFMPTTWLISIIVLVAFPLLELAILIKVGSFIGVGFTFLIILLTFILGVTVVRRQGIGVARRFVATANTGETPVEPMVDGMLLFFAGGCLIAPGLITDCIGLVLLVPFLRQWVARWILARGFLHAINVRPHRSPGRNNSQGSYPSSHREGPTIEAEFQRINDEPNPNQRPPPPTGAPSRPKPPSR